ncbi:MAG: nuclear transport factor 2 family protein [Acidimicrobiales bacterium]
MTTDDQVDGEATASVELLREIREVLNTRDTDAIVAYFAEDANFSMASGSDSEGRAVHRRAAIRNVLTDHLLVIPPGAGIRRRATRPDSAPRVRRVTGNAGEGTVLDIQGRDFLEFREGLVPNKDTDWKIVI